MQPQPHEARVASLEDLFESPLYDLDVLQRELGGLRRDHHCDPTAEDESLAGRAVRELRDAIGQDEISTAFSGTQGLTKGPPPLPLSPCNFLHPSSRFNTAT